jgi:hypothetical protein
MSGVNIAKKREAAAKFKRQMNAAKGAVSRAEGAIADGRGGETVRALAESAVMHLEGAYYAGETADVSIHEKHERCTLECRAVEIWNQHSEEATP